MGKDFRYFLYVTDCHGPLSWVSWLHVPEQVEFGRELALGLPYSILSFMGFELTHSYQFFSLVARSTRPMLLYFIFHCTYLFSVYVHAHAPRHACEHQRITCRSQSFLLPRGCLGSQGSNSGCQTWWHTPLAPEPSHQPRYCNCDRWYYAFVKTRWTLLQQRMNLNICKLKSHLEIPGWSTDWDKAV